MSRSAISTIEEENESQPTTPTPAETDAKDGGGVAVPAKAPTDESSGTAAAAAAPAAAAAVGAPREETDAVSATTKGAGSVTTVARAGSKEDGIRSTKSEMMAANSSKVALTESREHNRRQSTDRRKSKSSKGHLLAAKEGSFTGRTGHRGSVVTHERDRLFSARAKSILAASVLSVRRPSFEPERMKVVKYMNTYRIESKNKFKPDVVTAIIKEVMTKELDDVRYDASTAPKLALSISAEIRARVKMQQYDRYKLVCVVDIGEKQLQSIYSAFRLLWDIERDYYAKYNYDNYSLFAVGCCFAFYRD